MSIAPAAELLPGAHLQSANASRIRCALYELRMQCAAEQEHFALLAEMLAERGPRPPIRVESSLSEITLVKYEALVVELVERLLLEAAVPLLVLPSFDCPGNFSPDPHTGVLGLQADAREARLPLTSKRFVFFFMVCFNAT